MMRKLIKEFKINKRRYVFNGSSLDLFDISDEDEYKKYLNEDDILDIDEEGSNHIAKVVLNVSNDCNLRCKYCYADDGVYAHKTRTLMSEETLDKILRTLEDRGINEIGIVSFFGGEPLLNFSLIKKGLMEFSSRFKIGVFEIVTNGILLNEEKINELSKYHVNLSVSIDGPKECTDELRGEGTFDKAYKALMLAKNKNFSNLYASATYTKIHENKGYSVSDIEKYFEKLGVKATVSRVLTKDQRLAPEIRFGMDQQKKSIENSLIRIEKNEKKGAINPFLNRVMQSLLLKTKSSTFCDDLLLENAISFDCDGSIFNCFHFWGDEKYDVSDWSKNEIIEKENDKNKITMCRECWARNFCKECVAAMMDGTLNKPMKKDGGCDSADIYEECLIQILELIEAGRFTSIANNFLDNFMVYKSE